MLRYCYPFSPMACRLQCVKYGTFYWELDNKHAIRVNNQTELYYILLLILKGGSLQ